MRIIKPKKGDARYDMNKLKLLPNSALGYDFIFFFFSFIRTVGQVGADFDCPKCGSECVFPRTHLLLL